MKKLLLIIVTILLFTPIIKAEEFKYTIYRVNDIEGIYVRSSATTNSSIVGSIANNNVVLVTDTVVSTDQNDNCENKTWYKISTSNLTGYSCAYYISKTEYITNNEHSSNYDYETELAKFDDTYKDKINYLHSIHPNWEFYADNTNLSWSNVIANESGTSKNLIQVASWANDYGYLLLSTYDWKTDKYKVFEGSNWYIPSVQTVEYYMDPRNFLDETNIFMFEYQKFSSNQKLSVVKSILNKTFMSNTYSYLENGNTITKNYAETFFEAGSVYNVSPYLLAARCKQELGSSGSESVSGTYSGYEGYYNYFNIGAGSGSNPVLNALKYAKAKGWSNPYLSIYGGAILLGEDYIAVGQDTLYYQKYNTTPRSSYHYGNQYMGNIQAPKSEAYSTYSSYLNTGSINDTFIFYIPVYSDMPSETSLPNKGSQNNWLSSIKIDNKVLDNYDGDKLTYDYKINYNVNKINITVDKSVSSSTVKGIGDIEIPLDTKETTLDIEVTAENKSIKTYSINITRLDNPSDITYPKLEEIMQDTGIKYGELYATGIKLQTSIDSIKEVIKASNKNIIVDYIKNSNNLTNTAATGDVISITSGEEKYELTVIIYGDLNGDSYISAIDLLKIKKNILKVYNMEDIYLTAADANKDGNVTSIDMLMIKKHILKTYTIIQ